MAAITPLHESDLKDLLQRYELGTLETYWPAGGGVENSNYFVRVAGCTGTQEVVVTMLEQPAAAGDLLVPLLDVCDDAGLPIAPIIRNRTGVAREELRGKPTLIAPRLIGRHVQNPTARHCETVGRFLARFHRAARHLAADAPAHPRDRRWLETRFDSERRHMSYLDASQLSDAIAAVASLLARSDVGRLPRGIIHGDLFRDNALFTERGLTGVLDFHHASSGFLLYDLAVAANDWCSDSSGLLDRERTLALLQSYHRIRRLELAEMWFFPLFVLYAAVTFWLSRLAATHAPHPPSGVAAKSPDEFRRIVRQHLGHCFYVDPRQLDVD